ncbi:MAG: hypothetical protein E7812_02125 [Phenylobacterium sp.]|nr:MAG: hypothetical protein E7812_02125 [Phenylobacterium sp.]
MAATRRRFAPLVPLTFAPIALSAIACFAVCVLKADPVFLGYSVVGFGIAAALIQWNADRLRIARSGQPGRNSLFVQVYGLVFFTGVCSIPSILLGRAIAGVNIWNGH